MSPLSSNVNCLAQVGYATAAHTLLSKAASGTLLNMPPVDRRMLVLRGALDLCLLALLAEGPVYGYELGERLANRGLTVGGGTAYPLLARLERGGLISAKRVASANGPVRKYWQLTRRGHEHLTAGRDEWSRIITAVDSVLNSSTSTSKENGE